jgi:hypothetical protein
MSLIKVTSIVHPSGTANNITLDNAGNVTIGNDLNFTSTTLASPAVAGSMEYDGKALYMTPQGTQRGVVPGKQLFRLDANFVGSNVNTAQSILGVGLTLSSSTVYAFEGLYVFSRTAGTTSHSFSLLFGGTATLNNISYLMQRVGSPTGNLTDVGAVNTITAFFQTASASAFASGVTSATTTFIVNIKGTVSANVGGTFIPQYILSAAPGGAYSTVAGSHFIIYPIGASGANVSVGTWA